MLKEPLEKSNNVTFLTKKFLLACLVS